MKNNLVVHMRYHLFLHYGQFLQNLGKDFIPSIMHTTVAGKGPGIIFIVKQLRHPVPFCLKNFHTLPNLDPPSFAAQKRRTQTCLGSWSVSFIERFPLMLLSSLIYCTSFCRPYDILLFTIIRVFVPYYGLIFCPKP